MCVCVLPLWDILSYYLVLGLINFISMCIQSILLQSNHEGGEGREWLVTKKWIKIKEWGPKMIMGESDVDAITTWIAKATKATRIHDAYDVTDARQPITSPSRMQEIWVFVRYTRWSLQNLKDTSILLSSWLAHKYRKDLWGDTMYWRWYGCLCCPDA